MKILVVSTNFPPRANSIRVTHFIKYLAQKNNQIQALTYDKEYLLAFSKSDEFLHNKIDKLVKINFIKPGLIRRKFINTKPSGHAENLVKREKAKSNLLLQFLIPDPNIDSLFNLYKNASKIINEFNPDVIITLAYPFTLHVLGYFIKRKFNKIIWVADYGDPWVESPTGEIRVPDWRKKFDRYIESKILAIVDLVLVTTAPTREIYLRNYPFLKGRLKTLTMGFDSDDFNIRPMGFGNSSKKIKIIHTGSIYSEARNPFFFIDALSKISEENQCLKDHLEIYFIGRIDRATEEKIQDSKIRDIFKYISWVTMDESIRWMKSADYLLLFGNYGAVQIPGKLFQYIGSERPIILLYETEEDPVIPILRAVDNSLIVRNDSDQIKETITKIITGKISHHKTLQPHSSSQYSWESICAELNSCMLDILTKKSLQ